MSCPHPCHPMACSCPPVLGWGTHDREHDYVIMVTIRHNGERQPPLTPTLGSIVRPLPAPVAPLVGSTEVETMLKEKMRVWR